MEFVPGGLMLILFGVNEDNAVVQNTVALRRNNDHRDDAEQPLAEGDIIGWVTLQYCTPLRAAFCLSPSSLECNKSSYFYRDFGLIYYNSNIRNIKIRTYYHS